MKVKAFPKFLICAFLLLSLAQPSLASAQGSFRVHVDQLDNDRFPYIEAFISVSDSNGLPIEGLTANAFLVSEDGQPITPKGFSAIDNVEQSLAIAVVMDVSTSMGGGQPTPLEKSVTAAKAFVDQLSTQDEVAVIKFSDEPSLVTGLTTDREVVKQALDALAPEKNRTAMYDGIVEAVNALKTHAGRRIIVLITDGEDTHTGLFDLDQAVREATVAGVSIHPIGFGNLINVGELKRMGTLTGGVARIQPNVFEIETAFQELLQLLRKQYLIQYVSAFPADGAEHGLLVAVDYQSGQEQDEYSFLAKSSEIPIELPGYQDNQVVGGMETFAPVLDWPAPVTGVQVMLDGTQLANLQNEPYEYNWNSTEFDDLEPGLHRFEFIATDIAGNTGTKSLLLDVQPPLSVTITAPTEGGTQWISSRISAEVSSLGDVSVGKVEFLMDGMVIATFTAPPYEMNWNWTGSSSGMRVLSVVATDSTGLFHAQDTVVVNVGLGVFLWVILIFLVAVGGVVTPIVLRRRRARRPGVGAMAPGRATLRELEGLNPNQVWSLGTAETRLGRKRDENDIPLRGLKASRRHAVIHFEQGYYVIYSLNPSNPVVVNNVPVPNQQVLQPGDVIKMGDTVLQFEA